MSNIAISELDTEATTLENDDLLLVSKKNGDSFTSAKMKGSVLKGSSGSCNFSSDTVKIACKSAIDEKNVSTLTQNDIKNQCTAAIESSGGYGTNRFLDYVNIIELKDLTTDYTIPKDGVINGTIACRGSASADAIEALKIDGTIIYCMASIISSCTTLQESGMTVFRLNIPVKKGQVIRSISGSTTSMKTAKFVPYV